MADESEHRQELLKTLSPREREVLRYDCQGQSSGQIALKIYRSESDVNQRLSAIYQKLKLPGPKERNARQRQLQMFCLELPRLGEDFFAGSPTSEETLDERPLVENPSPEDIEIFTEDQRALALLQPLSLVRREWEVVEQPLPSAGVRWRPRATMLVGAAILVFILGGIATVAAERFFLPPALPSTGVATPASVAPPAATPRLSTTIPNPSTATPVPAQPTQVLAIATPAAVARTIVVSPRPYLSPVSSGCTISIVGTDSLKSACELPLLDALQGSHDRTVESWFKTGQPDNSNLLTVTPRQNDVPVHVESGQAMDIALVGAKGPGGCGSQAAAGLYVHFQDSDVHIAGPSLGDSRWHYVAVTVAAAGTLVRVEIDGQEPGGYVWEPLSRSCYPDKPQAQPIQLSTPANTLPQSVRVGVPGWAERGFVGDLELAVRPVALDPVELRMHYEQGKGAHAS